MKQKRKSVEQSRALRRTMTLPERRLWNVLRTGPGGLKFRRQHPLGPYSLDFFCHAAALAIEVDGISHEMGDRPSRDARRDAWIGASNIEVLRVPAIELKGNLESVVQMILARCHARRPPPPGCARSPSPGNPGEANPSPQELRQ